MPEVLRAGIVGVGFRGQVRARAVRGAGGVVSRVVGSSPGGGAAGAERLRAGGAGEDIAALVNDPQADLVHGSKCRDA